jgi:Flp pilus assembly pilin Flp
MTIATKIINFINNERGNAAIEYGIISVTIAAGVAGGLTATKNSLQEKNTAMLANIDVDPV